MSPGGIAHVFISHNVFSNSLIKSEFLQKSVDLFFILVVVQDKLTDLWGSGTLQNDFKNTFCQMSVSRHSLAASDLRGPLGMPRPVQLTDSRYNPPVQLALKIRNGSNVIGLFAKRSISVQICDKVCEETGLECALIAHTMFLQSFCRSQIPRKFVNVSFIITNTKNKLTNLCGN